MIQNILILGQGIPSFPPVTLIPLHGLFQGSENEDEDSCGAVTLPVTAPNTGEDAEELDLSSMASGNMK